MMKSVYEVKPLGPAFNQAVRFVRVHAFCPKTAAEQVLGRELSESGDAHSMRALVKTGAREMAFYLPASP
jgi:hypothetical protein